MNDQIGTELLLSILSDWNSEVNHALDLSPTNWEKLWQASATHGLPPLLFHRLSTLGLLAEAPPTIAKKLRQNFYLSARRNTVLFQHLAENLQALNTAAIPVIVLKGAYLAEQVYDDPALRPMSDIDLLVSKETLPDVLDVFSSFGYQSRRDFDIQDELTRAPHLPSLLRADGDIFEIHWTISSPAYPFRVDLESIWERAHPATISSEDTLVLSPEDALLHLAIHTSYKHNFSLGLMPIYDIAALLHKSQDTFDWEYILLQAESWGIAKCVFTTLELTRDLLCTPIPEGILTSLQPEVYDPVMFALIKEHVLSGQPQLTINLAELMDNKSIADKIPRLLGRIFFSREVMAREYNLAPDSRSLYLHYFIRLWNELIENIGEGWRLAIRDPETLASAQRQNQIMVLHDWLGTP